MTMTLTKAAGGLTTEAMAARFGVVPDTVRNWIHFGVIGGNGKKVKLAAVRFGGKYRVTEEAMELFLRAQNIGSHCEDTPDAGRISRA